MNRLKQSDRWLLRQILAGRGAEDIAEELGIDPAVVRLRLERVAAHPAVRSRPRDPIVVHPQSPTYRH